MDCPPDTRFITSLIQLKLDPATSFAWKESSKELVDEIPEYDVMLRFLDQRARSSDDNHIKKSNVVMANKKYTSPKTVTIYLNTSFTAGKCQLCRGERHPLYVCPKFKSMTVAERRSSAAARNACFNCLRSGHRPAQCMSSNRYRHCQKPHNTLLHVHQEQSEPPKGTVTQPTPNASAEPQQVVTSTAVSPKTGPLLMTCQILVTARDATSVEARALLDPGAQSSFVTERIAGLLRLPKTKRAIDVSGIAATSTGKPVQTVTMELQDISHLWKW